MNVEQFEAPKQEGQASNRRLIINRIAMENFKSYFGRLEIGPFHRRFTAIVGPNGSGKSNLIESLLFVFGKRANWMRLKSLHQLIHSSSRHSDVRKASVEVEFMEVEDHGSETVDLPNTKFTVRRTVHHTGQSHYNINDSNATLEEVTTLLMGKGIDLTNNRFLILQGEVEQISLMKPKSGDSDKPGLIEYLEDIIGSSLYQERIETLQTDAEKLETMRRERGEVMRIVESDLNRLEPAKDKAIEFVKREKQGMQLQNIQMQVALHRLTTKRDQLANEIKKLEEEQKQIHKDSRDKVKDNQESANSLKQAKEASMRIKEVIKKLETDLAQTKSKDEQIVKSTENLSEQQVKCQKRIDEIIKERNNLTDEHAEQQLKLPHLEEEMKSLVMQRDAAEVAYKALESEHRDKTYEYKQQVMKLKQKISAQETEREKLKSEIDFLESQHKNLGGRGQDHSSEMTRLSIEITKKSEQVAELKEVITKIEEVNRKIAEKTQEHLTREKALEAEIMQLDSEIRQIKLAGDSLHQSQNQQKDTTQTVKAIMDASAKGILSGVIGRMGDLGWIPAKYDVAAATCSAGGLNSILVENEEAAKRCIDFLKQHKIGRQGFYCLNKLRETLAREMDAKFNPIPNTNRLFDLVTPRKEAYKVAFMKVFGNTLVCDNLDIANDIRFKQNKQVRIVTLDGKLIEQTGVMSGGGQTRRGLICTNAQMQMQQSAGDGNLNELKRRYEMMCTRKSELEQALRKCQDERIKVEKEAQTIQSTEAQRRRDLQGLIDLIEEQEKERSTLQGQSERLAKGSDERKHYESEINSRRSRMKVVEDGYRSEQQEIESIQKKIDKLESSDLKHKKDEYQNMVNRTEKLEESLGKQKEQFAQFEKRMKKKMSEEKEQLTKMQKLTEQVEKNKETQTQIENHALQIIGQLKAESEELLVQERRYNEMKEKNHSLMQLLDQLKKRIAEIKEQIDENRLVEHSIDKSGEEIKNMARSLEEMRNTYRDIVREYDFLNEIDEIANYTVQDVERTHLEDFTLLNISMVEDYNAKGQLIDDEAPVKRRSNVVSQLQHLMDFEPTETLGSESLEMCFPIEKEIVRMIAHVQAKTNEAAKETNIQDIKTYKSKYLDYKEKKAHLDRVKEDVAANKNQLKSLKKERYDMFMAGYNVISQRLRETYQTLTTGGDAQLELVDTMDPFSEGVQFSVRPKNKTWKQMSKLSGGEKTLSSLSLIFALHHFRPTPLYFFDEVDAALDYRNVQIIGNFVKERTKNAQFIVISLRNNMFELADKLVGIYKTFDITKTISIQPQMVQQKMLSYNEDSENSRHLANQQ